MEVEGVNVNHQHNTSESSSFDERSNDEVISTIENIDDDAKMTLESESNNWEVEKENRSNDPVEADLQELEEMEEDVKHYYVADNDDSMDIEEMIEQQEQGINIIQDNLEEDEDIFKQKADDLDSSSDVDDDDDDDFEGFDEEPYEVFEIKQINKRIEEECISENEWEKNEDKNQQIKKETEIKDEKLIDSNIENDSLTKDAKDEDSKNIAINIKSEQVKKNDKLKTIENNKNVREENVKETEIDSSKLSHNEIYFKPLRMGWKREYVQRANPSSSKDRGEAYYITPGGKKLRTKNEIIQYLTPDLTIDNFTFAREPIGFGPEGEIVRSAKLKASATDPVLSNRKSSGDSNLGKRVPKPKAPKGASPPPQGWTASKAVKATTVTTSPRTSTSIKNAEDNEIKMTGKSTPKSSKQTKKGKGCTIQCIPAMGTIPQLQCVKCLNHFHHECVGTDHKDGSDNQNTMKIGDATDKSMAEKFDSSTNTPYICETCINAAMSSSSSSPSSVQQKLPNVSRQQNTTTEHNITTTTTTVTESELKNQSISSSKATTIDQNTHKTTVPKDTANTTITTAAEAEAATGTTTHTSIQTLPPSQTVSTASSLLDASYDNNCNIPNSIKNNSNIELSANLPQSIAVIKGRKYVVIRKSNIPSASSLHQQHPDKNDCSNNRTNKDENIHTDLSTVTSLTTWDDMSSRRKSNIPRQKISPLDISAGSNSQQSSVALNRASFENFSANFFGNLSVGYDILLHTFQYLKVQELLRAACVCRMWNVAANHRSLWRTVRMKNSQINNWTGLSVVLKRNETKHLDLRKMLISSTNGDEMWTSFSNNIQNVTSLEAIDLCRCSSKIVENIFLTNPNLKILNAVSIKDNALNLENLCRLKDLQELRLKPIDDCALESDLTSFRCLKNLKHLSLTSFIKLGTKEIGILGELVCLETLELGECTDFNLEFVTDVLPKLKKLERLRLEQGQEPCCTLNILEAVSKLPCLTQLELVNFDVRTGFDDKLSQCKNLKKLLLIPTYVSQSATTNNIILRALLNLSGTLRTLTWVVTLELLRVTALYVVQCDDKKKDNKVFDESIPVLKPVPNSFNDENNENSQKVKADVPQVEILPLAKVEKILSVGMPETKFKILKVPYHATWRQNLIEIQ